MKRFLSFPERLNPLKLILVMGLLVGSLDIGAAFIEYYIDTGKGPEDVLRFIASGAFGKMAFTDNNLMILWGLLFHFLITYSFTIFFYWLSQKIKFMSSQMILTSILYGIFIWLAMTLIVLPLSHIPKNVLRFKKEVVALLILIAMIGLPLSLLIKKFSGHIR